MRRRRWLQALVIVVVGAWTCRRLWQAPSLGSADWSIPRAPGLIAWADSSPSAPWLMTVMPNRLAPLWLIAGVVLTVVALDFRKPRLRPMLPGAASALLAVQGVVAGAPLPELLAPVATRLDRLLAVISGALGNFVPLSAGLYVWSAIPAILAMRATAPEDRSNGRSRTSAVLVAAGAVFGLVFVGVGGAILIGGAVALAIQLQSCNAPRRGSEADPLGLSRWALLCSMLVAALIWRWNVPESLLSVAMLARFSAASLLIAVIACLGIEAVARRREMAAADPTDEPVVVDGRSWLNPFAMPSEARVRVALALLFGASTLAYHSQILAGALAAAMLDVGAPALVATLANAIALVVLAALPLGWMFVLARPAGLPMLMYDPHTGLTASGAATSSAQAYDSELAEVFRSVLEQWKPERPFVVYRTRGHGSPSVGYANGSHFVELPAGTLHAFFARGDRARVEAMVAHEIAHVVHRDPLPLAAATVACTASVLYALPAAVALALSSQGPSRAYLPLGRWDVWALVSLASMVSFAGLLRAAQRKVELLADARAALHLKSLEPVRGMVSDLISLEARATPAAPAESPYGFLRLGATSKHRAQGSTWWRRALSRLDTHEPLDRRLATLSRGMHALVAPDATTVVIVSATAWLLFALSSEIALPTWSPVVLGVIVGATATLAHLLEYYFLATLTLSPRGSRATHLGAWSSTLASVGGAMIGLLLSATVKTSSLVGQLRSPSLPKVIALAGDWSLFDNVTSRPYSFMADGEQARAEIVSFFRVLGLTTIGIAFVLLVLYAILRWFVLRQLQRTARALCFAYPSASAGAIVQATFLSWALLGLVPWLTFHWAPLLILEVLAYPWRLMASAKAPWVVAGMVALAMAGAALALVTAWMLPAIIRWRARRSSCCASRRKRDDRWMVHVLYDGCPDCGALPAGTLTRWHPRDASPRARHSAQYSPRSVGTRILAAVIVLVVLTPFGLPLYGDDGAPIPRDALREYLALQLDRDEGRAAIVEEALHRNLGRHLNATPGDARVAVELTQVLWFEREPDFITRIARSVKPVTEASAADPVTKSLTWYLMLNPGRIDRDAHLAPGLAGYTLLLPVPYLYATLGEMQMPWAGSQLLECESAPLDSAASGLAQAMCQVSIGKGAEATAALSAFHGGPPKRGEVGVLWGIAALLNDQPLTAIEKATASARLCEREPGKCPGKTREALFEIVTFAAARGYCDARRAYLGQRGTELLAEMKASRGKQAWAKADRELTDLRLGYDGRIERALVAGGWSHHLRAYRAVAGRAAQDRAALLAEEVPDPDAERVELVLPRHPYRFLSAANCFRKFDPKRVSRGVSER